MPEQTFKLKTLADAWGEGVSTIQSWIDKKWIEFPPQGQGKARELSVLDAYMLALTLEIRKTGVPTSTAGNIARGLVLSPGASNRARNRQLAELGTTEEEIFRAYPAAYVELNMTRQDLDEPLKNRNLANPHIALVELGRSPLGESGLVEKSLRWRISFLDTSKHQTLGYGIFFNITDILVFTDNALGLA